MVSMLSLVGLRVLCCAKCFFVTVPNQLFCNFFSLNILSIYNVNNSFLRHMYISFFFFSKDNLAFSVSFAFVFLTDIVVKYY